MKRIIHICLWLLTGIFAEVSLSAQNPFIYHKGKTYKDVAAYRMEEIIDLNTHTPSTPILYEQQVPEHQSTLSYKVALPLYVRGIFFSRDSRPGDYQWPNNTNRLLPWMFNHLEDLTRSDYASIPSNALPSASGDALLLELADGEYLFAKAIAGSNSLSWFQVNQDGTLTLYVSTLGEDALTGRLPLLIFRKSSSIYHVFSDAYDSLIADKAVSALRKRADKQYFNAFDYLGWCTWEHYHSSGYSYTFDNTVTAKDDIYDYTQNNNSLMLYPQSLTDAKITVKYKTEKDNATFFNGSKEVALTGEWTNGQSIRYILTLPVGAEKMSVNTTYDEDWNATDNEQTPKTPVL